MLELIYLLLYFEEGYRSKVYYCSERYPTIGIGWKLGPKGAPLKYYTMTVNKATAKEALLAECAQIIKELEKHDWFTRQNEDRKAVLISMAYQMGTGGLFKFKNMIKALKEDDYRNANIEAIDSRWYTQTPTRATRHARVLECGDLSLVYGDKLQ